MGKWLRKLFGKLDRALPHLLPLRLIRNLKGAIANQIVGLVVALFIIGAVGATAVVMCSNATAYEGAPSPVITVFTVAIPVLAGVAIMLYLLPRRS